MRIDMPKRGEVVKNLQDKQLKSTQSTNKKRGKEMEDRIAAVLGGYRVPFSGAGPMKGDVLLTKPFGTILVECKMSAGLAHTHKEQRVKGERVAGKVIRVFKRWFEKMEEDRRKMRSVFAILITHFYRDNTDYVFIPRKAVKLLFPQFNFEEATMQEITVEKHSFVFRKNAVNLMPKGNALVFQFDDFAVVCIHLSFFVDLLESHYPAGEESEEGLV